MLHDVTTFYFESQQNVLIIFSCTTFCPGVYFTEQVQQTWRLMFIAELVYSGIENSEILVSEMLICVSSINLGVVLLGVKRMHTVSLKIFLKRTVTLLQPQTRGRWCVRTLALGSMCQFKCRLLQSLSYYRQKLLEWWPMTLFHAGAMTWGRSSLGSSVG